MKWTVEDRMDGRNTNCACKYLNMLKAYRKVLVNIYFPKHCAPLDIYPLWLNYSVRIALLLNDFINSLSCMWQARSNGRFIASHLTHTAGSGLALL